MAPWMARRASTSATRMATVLITAINIIAGFLIGVFQLDIPFRDALKTYTILTVGDGLVTIIPSLLVSVAAASWSPAPLPTTAWAAMSASSCSGAAGRCGSPPEP